MRYAMHHAAQPPVMQQGQKQRAASQPGDTCAVWHTGFDLHWGSNRERTAAWLWDAEAGCESPVAGTWSQLPLPPMRRARLPAVLPWLSQLSSTLAVSTCHWGTTEQCTSSWAWFLATTVCRPKLKCSRLSRSFAACWAVLRSL